MNTLVMDLDVTPGANLSHRCLNALTSFVSIGKASVRLCSSIQIAPSGALYADGCREESSNVRKE